MQVTTTRTTGARHRARLAILASLAVLAGLLTVATTSAAATYPYKPPVEVYVANTTTTTAEITFRTVTGAPIYRVKAVASGHKTRTAYTGADGNWVITGLDPNTTYTFTVACAMKKGSGYVLLSKESSGSKGKKSAKTKNFPSAMQYPTTVVDGAPVDQALWLADTANPTKSQFYNGADISVKVPTGFNYSTHGLRFSYAKDQRMSTGKGTYDTFPTAAPTDPTATTSATSTSNSGTTTAASPSPSVSSPATSPATSATASATPTVAATETATAVATPTATAEAATSGGPATAVTLASTVRGYAKLRVPLPSANTNYYVRVQVINKSDRKIVSDTSQALLVKTRSKFGFISGTVRDANGNALSANVCQDYVVQAYGPSTFSGGTGKDLQQQVGLVTTDRAGVTTCTGDFTLEVRPNSGYTVRAAYVGKALNWQPAWYRSGASGVAARSVGATEVAVSVGQTTKLANAIRVSTGATVTGTAKCPTGSGTAPSGTCTVDVAAIIAGSYNNVITPVRSNSSGVYTLTGLPAGTYVIRVTKTDDSTFPKVAQAVAAKVKYVEKSNVTVAAGATVTVNVP